MNSSITKKPAYRHLLMMSFLLMGSSLVAQSENSAVKKVTVVGGGVDTTKDPIQIINGNNLYNVDDIMIPCPLVGIQFSRSYNSQLMWKGVLGHRWCHSYDWTLFPSSTSVLLQAVVDLGMGTLQSGLHPFNQTTTGVFTAVDDAPYRLTATETGYRLLAPGGIVRVFDTNGVMTSISHLAGQGVSLSYVGAFPTQKLVRVEHSNGQYLNFDYESGLLARVRSPSDELSMTFYYNAFQDLTNAVLQTSRGVFQEVYDYGEADGFTDHCLRRRVGKTGTEFFFDYIVADGGGSLCTGMYAGPEKHYEVELIYTLPWAERVATPALSPASPMTVKEIQRD